MTDDLLRFKKQRRTVRRWPSVARVIRRLAPWLAVLAMMGGVVLLLQQNTPGAGEHLVARLWNQAAAPFRPAPAPTEAGITRRMAICTSGTRINCVIDGDTVWVDGEKIRLETINAPEIRGECRHERQIARQATHRLSVILSSSPFHIQRSGKDRYGRTLATLSNKEGDVGQILIRENLAHPWRGRREGWC